MPSGAKREHRRRGKTSLSLGAPEGGEGADNCESEEKAQKG